MELTAAGFHNKLQDTFYYNDYTVSKPDPKAHATAKNLQPLFQEYIRALEDRTLYIHETVIPQMKELAASKARARQSFMVPSFVYNECDPSEFSKTIVTFYAEFFVDKLARKVKWHRDVEGYPSLYRVIGSETMVLSHENFSTANPVQEFTPGFWTRSLSQHTIIDPKPVDDKGTYKCRLHFVTLY